jgi:hypothetical protein
VRLLKNATSEVALDATKEEKGEAIDLSGIFLQPNPVDDRTAVIAQRALGQ